MIDLAICSMCGSYYTLLIATTACESLQTDVDRLVPVYVAVQVKQGSEWADIAQTETVAVGWSML